jgi:hypothetical protein
MAIGPFFKLAFAAAFFSLSTAADAAPPQLLNKTITVSTNVSVPAIGSDGTNMTRSRQKTRMIYVSSQGRLFVRVTQKARREARDKEIGPNEGGTNLHFVGDKLIGNFQFSSGASQLTISFDPSFQNCSADLVIGTEPGKPRVWKSLNGVTLTSTGKSVVTGTSCAIRDGNAFAD